MFLLSAKLFQLEFWNRFNRVSNLLSRHDESVEMPNLLLHSLDNANVHLGLALFDDTFLTYALRVTHKFIGYFDFGRKHPCIGFRASHILNIDLFGLYFLIVNLFLLSQLLS